MAPMRMSEEARVAALRKWSAADPHNPRVAQIVDEAVATGKSEADVKPALPGRGCARRPGNVVR